MRIFLAHTASRCPIAYILPLWFILSSSFSVFLFSSTPNLWCHDTISMYDIWRCLYGTCYLYRWRGCGFAGNERRRVTDLMVGRRRHTSASSTTRRSWAGCRLVARTQPPPRRRRRPSCCRWWRRHPTRRRCIRDRRHLCRWTRCHRRRQLDIVRPTSCSVRTTCQSLAMDDCRARRPTPPTCRGNFVETRCAKNAASRKCRAISGLYKVYLNCDAGSRNVAMVTD